MVVDYRGQVLHMIRNQGDAFSAAAINIDGLRQHRAAARHNNWAPHMKGELFRVVYDKMAVWPKNLALDHPPRRREATEEIYFQVIRKLQEDGVQVAPGGAAEPAGPKPVAGAKPVAGQAQAGPERPAANEGSLKDYILGRTTRLSGGDDRRDERKDDGAPDRDTDPLAAE